MPFHFCSDELMAIMAALPFVGVAVARLRAWWHARHAARTCIHTERHE